MLHCNVALRCTNVLNSRIVRDIDTSMNTNASYLMFSLSIVNSVNDRIDLTRPRSSGKFPGVSSVFRFHVCISTTVSTLVMLMLMTFPRSIASTC